MMMGYAYQQGMLPLGSATSRAIEVNGVRSR